MKLPHGENAFVDISNLRDYCLSEDHLRGRHKARVFAAAIGLTLEHADELHAALLLAAKTAEATASDSDEYGQRYVVDFRMKGPTGEADVRSSWIVRTGEDFPRLTS